MSLSIFQPITVLIFDGNPMEKFNIGDMVRYQEGLNDQLCNTTFDYILKEDGQVVSSPKSFGNGFSYEVLYRSHNRSWYINELYLQLVEPISYIIDL